MVFSALALDRAGPSDDGPGPPDDGSGDALRLPEPPARVRRSGIPLVASAIPVLAAGGLWLATGTATMLWFAALGPLIALGSIADAARTARRDRRRVEQDGARARRRVRAAVDARHDAERRARWQRHPDVLRLLRERETGQDEVWRPVAGRGDELVVGTGAGRSAVRVDGGGDDADAAALRGAAAVLEDAPRTVPAADGIAVIGPDAPARAVVRALVLQLCLCLPPDRLRIADVDDDAGGEAWLRALPHASSRTGRVLAVCAPAQAPPQDADIVIARVRPGDPVPPRCGVVLTMTRLDRARLAGDGRDEDLRVEAVGAAQAMQLARLLATRAADTYAPAAPAAPVALADLLDGQPPDVGAGKGGARLAAPLGTDHGRPFVLDLIADGPHAVIAGVTGSGKSALLTTWITALCARCSTAQVSFLLADFKGGTAFDALAGMPHVTGVITDLDAGGARRALQSLRAELRRRESEIVGAGAHDIDGTGMPRLIVVVDEYAALTASHPELVDLFTDIAARGRALGVHLILGTQRAGAFRESLLANCPLRIGLRLTDPADSRVLLGTEDAGHLSGAPEARGIALVRRAADAAPRTVRIALSSAELIARTTASATGPAPRRPWLPPLPERLDLADALVAADQDGFVLGIADEPEQQRQRVAMLAPAERGVCVLGSAGSGRTSLLATVAAQARHSVWVPPHPEQAWDVVADLVDSPPRTGTVVLVDDLDALLARYPADYGQALAERLENVIHAAGPGGAQVVLAAQRLTGTVTRLADLVPRRVLLALSSRAEFLAAGGAAADFSGRLPAGRAVIDGALVQLALPPGPRPHVGRGVPGWDPRDRVTAAVTRSGDARARVHAAASRAGVEAVGVGDALARFDRGELPEVGTVVVGDGEQWQHAWRLWQALRAVHDVLIDADSAADYRLLTGDRALPPYCLTWRGRAWLIRAGGTPARVCVAGATRR